MNTKTKQRLENRLASVESQIEKAEAGFDVFEKGIASFEVDTGESDQKVIFRSENALQKYLTGLYATAEWIDRRLSGRTFTSVKVRRKP